MAGRARRDLRRRRSPSWPAGSRSTSLGSPTAPTHRPTRCSTSCAAARPSLIAGGWSGSGSRYGRRRTGSSLGGRTLYTWCTPDTLELPALLGQPARVESRCFATGEPLRVDVDPAGVRELEPDEAVVSMVLPDVCTSDFRPKLCDEQHFFSSATAAAGWHADRPKAIVVPVRSGFALTRLLVPDVPPPVTPCSIFQRSDSPVNRNEDFPSELFRPVPGPVRAFAHVPLDSCARLGVRARSNPLTRSRVRSRGRPLRRGSLAIHPLRAHLSGSSRSQRRRPHLATESDARAGRGTPHCAGRRPRRSSFRRRGSRRP